MKNKGFTLVQLMIVIIIIAILAFIAIPIYANMEKLKKEQHDGVLVFEESYSDNGQGMAVLDAYNSVRFIRAYQKWSKDYPDRAQSIITTQSFGFAPQWVCIIYEDKPGYND
ncbi:MAG: prepilin-type N-terminal cleavage/methylation domain-containing protein [Candidatus Komeilibacteria bacterium]